MLLETYVLIAALALLAVCVRPDETDIHAMVVGNRTLELAEDRQLTTAAHGTSTHKTAWISPDGTTVACTLNKGDEHILYVIKVDGGRPKVVLKGRRRREGEERLRSGQEAWSAIGPVTWSPDSQYVLVLAIRYRQRTRKLTEERYILVYRAGGQPYASIKVPKAGSGVFSPDSKQIAVAIGTWDADPSTITIYDLPAATRLVCVQCKEPSMRLEKWDGGSILQYDGDPMFGFPVRWLRQIDLHTGKCKSVRKAQYPGSSSPDGTYRIAEHDPPFSLVNTKTGKTILVMESYQELPEYWLPNGTMYVCRGVHRIGHGKRAGSLGTMWLVGVESEKMNTMCVAFDVGRYAWSSDCMRMAYISTRGRVRVAELAWRDPTPFEKLEAGLPLTEAEEKVILKDQGRQIGAALREFREAHPDKWPTAESAISDLLPYVSGPEVFSRPGSNTLIFKFFPPGKIGKHETLYVGELNPDCYKWRIVIDSDGAQHCTEETSEYG